MKKPGPHRLRGRRRPGLSHSHKGRQKKNLEWPVNNTTAFPLCWHLESLREGISGTFCRIWLQVDRYQGLGAGGRRGPAECGQLGSLWVGRQGLAYDRNMRPSSSWQAPQKNIVSMGLSGNEAKSLPCPHVQGYRRLTETVSIQSPTVWPRGECVCELNTLSQPTYLFLGTLASAPTSV